MYTGNYHKNNVVIVVKYEHFSKEIPTWGRYFQLAGQGQALRNWQLSWALRAGRDFSVQRLSGMMFQGLTREKGQRRKGIDSQYLALSKTPSLRRRVPSAKTWKVYPDHVRS